MISAVAQVVLEESGVMEQDVSDPAPPELIIMARLSIGGLTGNFVAPRMEELFQVLISPGDFFESFVGPIIEVHPRRQGGYPQGFESPYGIVFPEIFGIKARLKIGCQGL